MQKAPKFGCARRQRHRFSVEIHQRLRPLYRLDNWHGPLAWLEDLFVIAFAVWLYSLSSWLLPATWLLIGSRQRALATLLHEASHLTLCRNRTLNYLLGSWLSGWLVFQVFLRYQDSHVGAHHPYLGDEGRDPDIRNYLRQGLFAREVGSFVRRHLVPILLGARTPANLLNLARDRLLPTQLHGMPMSDRLEYMAFVLSWISGVGALWHVGLLAEFALLWLVPYFTTFQAVNWLIEVAEHFPLTRISNHELEMTRNRLGNSLENFFTGMHGENWHLIHHLLPGLPFWSLKSAHSILLADSHYAAANEKGAGLFVRGPQGAPSIVALLDAQIEQAHCLLTRSASTQP